MDCNGTRFHLLLGSDDWSSRCFVETDDGTDIPLCVALNSEGASVGWDADRHELTLRESGSVFPPAPGNRPPSPSARRGIAIDAFGDVFWISADEHAILFAPAEGGSTERYWVSGAHEAACETGGSAFRACSDAPPREPLTLRGLAITSDAYLVAGVISSPGLLVFDLHRGGAPRRLFWPADTPFEPFDMTATPDGGLAVLDSGNRRLWQLDRTLTVEAPWVQESPPPTRGFTAIDGTGAPRSVAPGRVTQEHATVVDEGPVAVESLSDGSLIVLHTVDTRSFSTVVRYAGGVRSGEASLSVARGVIEEKDRDRFTLRGYDFACLRRRDVSKEVLYVVASGGDQAFTFEIAVAGSELTLEPIPEFVGIRRFAGKGIVGSTETVLYDFGEQWIGLVPQRRNRYEKHATIIVSGLDGKRPGCVWHRLFLDACIPAECRVLIETRASDDPSLLDALPWNDEPALIRRPGGSELPWTNETFAAGIDTWELLFQTAIGRHLEIRITLRGTGRSTPRLRALRAYYPRFSYLAYLPAVYHEQPESADFLDRFLALFEGFSTTIEDRIAAVQILLDSDGAPHDALEWLAGWFGVALDPSWSDEKRRLFIRHAAHFFAWRGTRGALLGALRLALEENPPEDIFDVEAPPAPTGIRLVESFRRRAQAAVSRITPESLNLLQDRGGATAADSDSTDCDGSDDQAEGEDTSPDRLLWRSFLRSKYGSIGAFNAEHDSGLRRWSDLSWRDAGDVISRADAAEWEELRASVLPVRGAAHRFTVYLPLPPGSTDAADRLARARRIIQLEKPAHTVGDVDFYFTWFRVGEARLGEDTTIDLGSLSPYLLQPFVLRHTRLGMGYLEHDSSRIGRGRFVLARSCSSPTTNCPSGGPS